MALVLGFLLGSAGIVVALMLAGVDLSVSRQPTGNRPSAAPSLVAEPAPAPAASPAAAPSPAAQPHVIALSSAERAPGQAPTLDQAAQHLRQLQETYLEALARRRTDDTSMRALMTVRQQIAGRNPEVLRRQARQFREAASNGQSIAGYAPSALMLLAEANERLAADLDGRNQRPPQAALAQSVRQLPAMRPEARVSPAPAPRVAVVRPTPPRHPAAVVRVAPRAAARVAPRVAASLAAKKKEEEALYVVRFGPISFLDRAARIVGALRADGLSATVARGQEPRRFRVVSARLIRPAAERRRAELEGLGHRPTLRVLPGGMAQVELGPFTSRSRAEAVAAEIRRGGSYATVSAEGGTGHAIVVGPYPKSAINAVLDRIGARFGMDAAVTVRPVD